MVDFVHRMPGGKFTPEQDRVQNWIRNEMAYFLHAVPLSALVASKRALKMGAAGTFFKELQFVATLHYAYFALADTLYVCKVPTMSNGAAKIAVFIRQHLSAAEIPDLSVLVEEIDAILEFFEKCSSSLPIAPVFMSGRPLPELLLRRLAAEFKHTPRVAARLVPDILETTIIRFHANYAAAFGEALNASYRENRGQEPKYQILMQAALGDQFCAVLLNAGLVLKLYEALGTFESTT